LPTSGLVRDTRFVRGYSVTINGRLPRPALVEAPLGRRLNLS